MPDECLRILAAADLIVHAGDFVAASVLEELEQLAPVAAVHGNRDDASLRSRLPERLVVEATGVRLGVVHDGGHRAGRHERVRSWFPDCDVVVYGHTHLPEAVRVGAVWIVNPGSPTERRRAPARSMAVLEAGEPRLIPLA